MSVTVPMRITEAAFRQSGGGDAIRRLCDTRARQEHVDAAVASINWAFEDGNFVGEILIDVPAPVAPVVPPGP